MIYLSFVNPPPTAVPVHKSEESGRPGGGIGRDDVIYSQKEGNIHSMYSCT